MEPLKKIWSWVKQNWMIFVLVGIVVAGGAFVWQQFLQNKQVDSLMRENQLAYEAHTRDIREIQDIYERERMAQEEINKLFQEKLTQIEAEYSQRMSDIEQRTVSRRQTFIRETNGDAGEMARRLGERLGWRVEGQQ